MEGLTIGKPIEHKIPETSKELARVNRRRDKDEKKQQRRAVKVNDGSGPPIEAMDPADLGLAPLEEEEESAGAAPSET